MQTIQLDKSLKSLNLGSTQCFLHKAIQNGISFYLLSENHTFKKMQFLYEIMHNIKEDEYGHWFLTNALVDKNPSSHIIPSHKYSLTTLGLDKWASSETGTN